MEFDTEDQVLYLLELGAVTCHFGALHYTNSLSPSAARVCQNIFPRHTLENPLLHFYFYYCICNCIDNKYVISNVSFFPSSNITISKITVQYFTLVIVYKSIKYWAKYGHSKFASMRFEIISWCFPLPNAGNITFL